MHTDGRVAIRWENRSSPQIFLDNNPLYSSHDAVERCEKKIASLRMKPHSCIVVFSPILWLGIDRLLERCDEQHVVVFIELEPLLAQVAEQHMPHSLHRALQNYPQRYKLMFYNASKRLPHHAHDSQQRYITISRELSEIVQKHNVQHIEYCSLSGGYRLHAAQYRHISEHIESGKKHSIYNAQTLRHMGRLWIRNLLRNFVLAKKLQDWQELSTNWPIVVVGAGCSIDEDIHWLKQIAARVVIVAVDTAASILTQHGVPFDIVVVADAQIYNSYDLIGVDTSNTIVITDIFAHPSIHHVFDEKRLYWYCSNISSLMLLSLLEEQKLLPTSIPALGSVGVIAVYLSLNISTNRVFSIGLDCSYTIGKTHARGAPMIHYFNALSHYLPTVNIENYTLERLLQINNNQMNTDTTYGDRGKIRDPSLTMYESYIVQLSTQYHRYTDCSNNRPNRHKTNRLPTHKEVKMASKSNSASKINSTVQLVHSALSYKQRSNFIYNLYKQLNTKDFMMRQENMPLVARTTIDPKVIINMLSIDYRGRTHKTSSSDMLQHCRYSALDYVRRLQKFMVVQSDSHA